MKKIYLTLITKNQNSKIKAENFAELFKRQSENTELIEIEKYYKFENSYKIVFEKKLNVKESITEQVLEFAKKITSNWNIFINEEIELIFNKDGNSKFVRNEFNVIIWMQINIDSNNV